MARILTSQANRAVMTVTIAGFLVGGARKNCRTAIGPDNQCGIRKLALDAVKAGIRARGDKLSLYSHAQLVAQADAMIGPRLVEQAKRQNAERNSQDLHKSQAAEPQALSLCETHERNGAAR